MYMGGIKMAEEMDIRVVNIEEKLRFVCGKVKNKGREILSDYDITPPQFNALLTLIEYDGLTIGELSNKMYLACSTVTDLLDRMERNELVVRVKDEKDRRIVRIEVLDKGNDLIEKILNTRRQYLASVLVECTDEKMDELVENIELLNSLMPL